MNRLSVVAVSSTVTVVAMNVSLLDHRSVVGPIGQAQRKDAATSRTCHASPRRQEEDSYV